MKIKQNCKQNFEQLIRSGIIQSGIRFCKSLPPFSRIFAEKGLPGRNGCNFPGDDTFVDLFSSFVINFPSLILFI